MLQAYTYSSRHCRGSVKRFMDAHEVVMHEAQRNHALQIFNLLADCMACGNVLHILTRFAEQVNFEVDSSMCVLYAKRDGAIERQLLAQPECHAIPGAIHSYFHVISCSGTGKSELMLLKRTSIPPFSLGLTTRVASDHLFSNFL